MKQPKFKIGDLVQTTGSIQAIGKVEGTVEGGENLGFPWEDDTPHYKIKDIDTGVIIFIHEKAVEYAKQ